VAAIKFQQSPRLALHLTLARSSRVQGFKVVNWALQPRCLKCDYGLARLCLVTLTHQKAGTLSAALLPQYVLRDVLSLVYDSMAKKLGVAARPFAEGKGQRQR
jgi:hypothetical protein